MCPITLSIIAASTTAAISAAAAGGGVAGAAAAASAAAAAAATGAGVSAATTIGIAAGAASVGTATAATAGTAAALSTAGVAGGLGVGTGTGLAGTAVTAGGLLTEVAAFVSIGQGIHQNNEAKKRVRVAKQSAEDVANAKFGTARDQAARAVREEQEQGAADVIADARAQGVVHNLQNRSDLQVAALSREVDRESQSNKAALQLRLEAISGSVRDAYQNVSINRASAFAAAGKDPGNVGLALSLGSTALGSITRAAA